MNRREFMKASVAFTLTSLSSKVRAIDKKSKPNFIFILSDDQGWGDLGCYGHPKLKTPNLDKMASEGIRFTNFYVNSPVCSPTRVGFMTGNFPSRHSFHTQLFGSIEKNKEMKNDLYLNPKAFTITSILKKAGYKTAHVGKWHMSLNKDEIRVPGPKEYGIDFDRTKQFAWKKDDLEWNRQETSKLYVDQAIDFLENNREDPFYMQVWFNDPHRVYMPTEGHLKAYPEMPNHDMLKKYWAVITEMDKQIGRLINRVDKLGLKENTYIIFCSDNGPVDPSDLSANVLVGLGSAGPFRGAKGSLYEGGIRVPCIIKCPGKVPDNKIDEKTVFAGTDFLPTICNLAGVKLPSEYQSDGQDMSSAWHGKNVKRSKPLFWFYPIRYRASTLCQSPLIAVREGKWKLLMNPDGSRVELYDLGQDITETNNLKNNYPEVTSRLKNMLLEWYESLPPKHIEEDAGKLTYPWPDKKWDTVTEELE